MPIFELGCPECQVSKKVLATSSAEIGDKKICTCGATMRRIGTGPSTAVMERLDNGAMVKPVIRYSDAERVMQERHDKADPLAGKANRS
jgi:hydrogenase maturation factor